MFNKTLKRVLFFTASCARPGAESDVDMDEDDDMFINDGMMDDTEEHDGQLDFAMEDM